jgi:hypothetical protein
MRRVSPNARKIIMVSSPLGSAYVIYIFSRIVFTRFKCILTPSRIPIGVKNSSWSAVADDPIKMILSFTRAGLNSLL